MKLAQTMSQSPAPQLQIIDDFLPDPTGLFATLRDTVTWDTSMSARLTASFGVPYNYAQMVYPARPMPPALTPVIAQLREALGITFNNCLLNYYKTGQNKLGFHADETNNLQPETGIAIVSVGSPRKITFRSRNNKAIWTAYTLQPGSMLYMGIDVQHQWVHAIKKQKGVGPRISLTWRAFKDRT